MKNRTKEIKHSLYLKRELLKETKKEILALQRELDTINGYKRIERGNQYAKNKKRTLRRK